VKKYLTFILIALACAGVLLAEDKPVRLSLEAESGAVKVLLHTYQVGAASTNFDFVAMGGQELLYPFQRYSAIVTIKEAHQLRFLYQPLQLDTQITAKEAFIVDGEPFPANQPVDITYSFPFYRLSYLYDFIAGPAQLAIGGALQLRNASIRFSSVDGSLRVVSQNLGPVPAFIVSGRLPFGQAHYAAIDATGLYASSAFINGANFAFEGSILDASLRLGTAIAAHSEAFLNLRFLGGSAKGTSEYARKYWTQSEEKFTANYLATMSLTLGATLNF